MLSFDYNKMNITEIERCDHRIRASTRAVEKSIFFEKFVFLRLHHPDFFGRLRHTSPSARVSYFCFLLGFEQPINN